jgi:hypothetical protein
METLRASKPAEEEPKELHLVVCADERVPPLHDVPDHSWDENLTWESASRSEMLALLRRTSSANSALQKQIRELQEQNEKQSKQIQDLTQELSVQNTELQTSEAVKKLVHQNKQLLQKLQEAHKRGYEEGKKEVCALFEKIFSPAQMQAILTKKRVKWAPDDIAAAIALHSFSRKSYFYVQRSMKIPMPSESTLKRWAARIGVRPGLQENVLKVLQKLTEGLPDEQRTVCLSFDEMALMQRAQYNSTLDSVMGPNKHAQVLMIRPLIGSWKQAIYFGYVWSYLKII